MPPFFKGDALTVYATERKSDIESIPTVKHTDSVMDDVAELQKGWNGVLHNRGA